MAKQIRTNSKILNTDELLGFWSILFGILVQFWFVHTVLDNTLIGSVGIFSALSILCMLFFISKRLSLPHSFYIYWSLILLTAIIFWYMIAEGGIHAPSAMVAAIIPGIALFFLGKSHFILWAVLIISMYTFMLIVPINPSSLNIPLPTIDTDKMTAEYWAIAIIMVNAFSFMFMFMRQMAKRLKDQAITDPLTKALNRNGITNQLAQEFSLFKRYGNAFSIIILDADHFKNINDTYGHQTGDIVLVEITNAIKEQLRDTDSLARWGGEEFLAFLPQTPISSALQVAERIRKSIESAELKQDTGQTVKFTLSIGVSTVHTIDSDPEDVMKRADEALYQAKESGRNRVCVTEHQH